MTDVPEQLTESIYRIKIPFENIYTTVFIIKTESNCLIYDSGCDENAVNTYILPALAELRVKPDVILCSHSHGDHCGGLHFLSEAFPSAVVGFLGQQKYSANNPKAYNDGDILFDRFKLLNLKGHSTDGLAVFDLKNKVLLSGDCLQLNGVGRYGTGVADCEEYFKAIARIKELKPLKLFTSHEFYPLGFSAVGEVEVVEYLTECKAAVLKIRDFIFLNKGQSHKEIAELYNERFEFQPPIGEEKIRMVREYFFDD